MITCHVCAYHGIITKRIWPRTVDLIACQFRRILNSPRWLRRPSWNPAHQTGQELVIKGELNRPRTRCEGSIKQAKNSLWGQHKTGQELVIKGELNRPRTRCEGSIKQAKNSLWRENWTGQELFLRQAYLRFNPHETKSVPSQMIQYCIIKQRH